MAQTKKQRFREQKRKKPSRPATTKAAASKPTSHKEGNGIPKPMIIGGAAVAVIGAAVAAVMMLHPFGVGAPTSASATPSPHASQKPSNQPLTAPAVRTVLAHQYLLVIDEATASKVFESCKTGTPVQSAGRIRGENVSADITCKGTTIKAYKVGTTEELAQPGAAPAPSNPAVKSGGQ